MNVYLVVQSEQRNTGRFHNGHPFNREVVIGVFENGDDAMGFATELAQEQEILYGDDRRYWNNQYLVRTMPVSSRQNARYAIAGQHGRNVDLRNDGRV